MLYIEIANVIDDDKRLHSPPPYVLHKKFAVLPPPCPVYGVRQPTVPLGELQAVSVHNKEFSHKLPTSYVVYVDVIQQMISNIIDLL